MENDYMQAQVKIRCSLGVGAVTLWPRELCLMTGLRFGRWDEELSSLTSKFKDHVFGGRRMKIDQLEQLYNEDLSHIQDDDVVHFFSLAFKMWIYEVLPECRNLVTKYKLRVPRCVSWRSAGRIQWSQAKKFIKNAMKPKNRPVGIKPNEVDEEWWISSVEFIDKQQHDTTWSIFPPWFVPGLEQQDFQYSLGNGEHEPYPSIKSCDTVYIPMNIIKTHWFLVEFDLHSKKLRTYDSLTSHAGSDLGQKVDALVDFIEYAFGVCQGVHIAILSFYSEELMAPLAHSHFPINLKGAGENYDDVGNQKKKVVVLGTGWAGTSFLRNLKNPSYDVQVISPRNYFAFTPLLPSVTVGTVEARSVVEPIRNIVKKNKVNFNFCEAECYKIDANNKKVYCRSTKDDKEEFVVDYDYLVVAMGARVNTFNTPGVEENCLYLKIRRKVIDCFEKASLPNISDDERKRMLQFVVVGGGPTGVEFAAELHDFVSQDLVKLFDKRITTFAEEKFHRDGIDLKTGSMVVKVSDKEISTKEIKTGKVSTIPYGMAVWFTGNATRPVVVDFMKEIGQANRSVLATDEWLRVEGTNNIYALGDCATTNQRRVMEDISSIFEKADKDQSGTLTVKEFQEAVDDICDRYPQVQLYLKNKNMSSIVDLLKESNGDVAKEVNVDEFKSALSQVDYQVKNLPATAQVAA
ncbi:hypothetical protein L1987_03435 [Smallanthus sonchifolius]|uniref:Uncharacterized protein n=1 Tax=Smallanthus sonchifolius TaxID=185202 RepID=A0ACB9KAS6_9ASTR|nr:hypothetical protein L1987_03435 [Smallanthus sonchifolius]